MRVSKPAFSVTYNNKNITADIAKYMLSITYKDKTEGESDEVEIELEDVDLLWQNSWYPEKGAELVVTMGALNCGTFELDEIETKGPPDTVTIRGMATGIKNTLRTKKSDAHENKTLKQIAEKVASKNGMTIQGTVPDISIGRVTQNKESDVAFLKRISNKFGALFSVRGKVITFTSIYDIEKRGASFSVDKSDLESYSLKDKADGMVKAAKVRSKNAKNNESVEADLQYNQWQQEEGYKYPDIESEDEDVSDEYAENKQQGEAMAKANMHLSATNQQEGNIKMEFNPLACAGNNFTLTGFGKLAGKYHIKSSTHKIDRGAGSTSECDIKRIQSPTTVQQVSTKKKTAQPNTVKVQNYAISSKIEGNKQIPGNSIINKF